MSGTEERRLQRRCPRDGHPLFVETFQGVEIDRCRECDGVWLDPGEFSRIIGDPEAERSFPRRKPVRPVAARKCPGCRRGALVPRRYGHKRRGAEIGLCVRCGGMWIDVAALRRLAQVREEEPPPDGLRFPRTLREWFVALTGFPVELENPCTIVPYATWALLSANLAVFVYMLLFEPDPEAFFRQYGLTPRRALEGEFWGYFTSLFVHANIFHLLGNLFFLHVFGDNLEERYGSFTLLALYLLCGLAAGAASVWLAPAGTEAIPRVGASGAVSGLLGAYLIAFPGTRILFGGLLLRFIPLVMQAPVWVFVFIWLLLNVIGWWVFAGSGVYPVDHVAHLGGFAAGFGLGLVLAGWHAAGAAGEA